MAVELEFYLLRGGQTGDLSAPEGYCAVSRTDDDELLDALTANLAMLGIETLTANREGGPGQYEITIRHNRLPDAAHEAILLKYAMKSVAQAHGATLTFMSKPNDNLFGSASHIHQSLVSEQTGENLFYGSDGPHGLSKTASAYIAGGLATMGDFTCMWASTPNAFKRLEPYAGGAPSWAFANRAAALRVTAPDAERCRIENRAPGGEANPYLVVAASLAAGLYGIENGLEAPEPSTEGFYEDPELERVPMTLPAAIERFEASPVAREYFGEEFVRFYAGTRRWEVERERHHVSDWEVERYSGGL
jgi:glutamine synthetase